MASELTDEEGKPAQEVEEFNDAQAEAFDAGFSFSGYERDLIMLRRDKGYFDVSGISGADLVGDGRAAVFADIDNDGDEDIIVNGLHGPAHFLLENRLGQDAAWIRLELVGAGHPEAWGTIARLEVDGRIVTRLKAAGSGFLAQHDPRLLFGLGDDKAADSVAIHWPSGEIEHIAGPIAAGSYRLVEGSGRLETVNEKRFELPEPFGPDQAAIAKLRINAGDRLPDLALIDGPIASKLPEKGPFVISLWATWCTSCREEMPRLQALAERGLPILGVSIDDESGQKRMPAFLERLGVTYPTTALADGELQRLFVSLDVPVPMLMIFDEQMRLESAIVGYDDATEARLESMLD